MLKVMQAVPVLEGVCKGCIGRCCRLASFPRRPRRNTRHVTQECCYADRGRERGRHGGREAGHSSLIRFKGIEHKFYLELDTQ